METEKRWYAVSTRMRWEKKVSSLLTTRKIENYCPVNRIVRQWSDRKKTVEEPLFKCYVFVRLEEAAHLQVKKTDGVINFVYWLGSPAVIKDAEIDALKDFLSHYDNVQLEKIKVNIHDKVEVINGPFMSQEGDVLEVNHKTVKVMLPSLGYAIKAEIKKSDVRVIDIRTAYNASSEKRDNGLNKSNHKRKTSGN